MKATRLFVVRDGKRTRHEVGGGGGVWLAMYQSATARQMWLAGRNPKQDPKTEIDSFINLPSSPPRPLIDGPSSIIDTRARNGTQRLPSAYQKGHQFTYEQHIVAVRSKLGRGIRTVVL